MKTHRIAASACIAIILLTFSYLANAQSAEVVTTPPLITKTLVAKPVDFRYVRPTSMMKFRNYVFDTVGPYPIFVSAGVAGVDQFNNTPPEWHRNSSGFGKRFASDFGISTITTSTRYVMAAALKEDTLYYRCNCTGFLPRISHATLSTFTGRRGDDGHSVISLSSILSPYAGAAASVYGWYPDRYGVKDAFRMGNYSLLGAVAGNVALEFFYIGPNSLMGRMHLNNRHGSFVEGENR